MFPDPTSIKCSGAIAKRKYPVEISSGLPSLSKTFYRKTTQARSVYVWQNLQNSPSRLPKSRIRVLTDSRKYIILANSHWMSCTFRRPNLSQLPTQRCIRSLPNRRKSIQCENWLFPVMMDSRSLNLTVICHQKEVVHRPLTYEYRWKKYRWKCIQ